MSRLRNVLLMIAAVLALPLGALAAPAIPSGEDMTLGNPKAKVTVIEYASLACGHCAHFNNEVFPAFRKKYIDTGKVHYVYREFLTDPVAVAAAAALTARCAGPKGYFDVIDAFFKGQEEMFRTGKARDNLMRAGKAGGLSETQVDACLKNEAAQKALSARVQRYINVEKINATPTIVINGKRLEGGHDMAALDAAIAPLLGR
jgi:protein-disulfide isomerase